MDSITIRQVEINAERQFSIRLTEEELGGVEVRARYRLDVASLELIAMIRGHSFPPALTTVQVPATWWDHLLDTVAERFPRLRPHMRIRYRKIITRLEVYRLCPHHKLPAHVHIGWLGGFTE